MKGAQLVMGCAPFLLWLDFNMILIYAMEY